VEFSRRLEIAQMLDNGVSYRKIQKSTGQSSTTIARISKWLKKGKGGYRLILDRIHHNETSISSEKRLR